MSQTESLGHFSFGATLLIATSPSSAFCSKWGSRVCSAKRVARGLDDMCGCASELGRHLQRPAFLHVPKMKKTAVENLGAGNRLCLFKPGTVQVGPDESASADAHTPTSRVGSGGMRAQRRSEFWCSAWLTSFRKARSFLVGQPL